MIRKGFFGEDFPRNLYQLMNGAQQNLTNKEQQKATTKQFLKSKAIA
jgi:hypothetical protein